VQNRLGFVVTLAREVSEGTLDSIVAKNLRAIKKRLYRALLARVGTFCQEGISKAERRWLQQRSTPQAKRWNLLSDLSPEQLTHAA